MMKEQAFKALVELAEFDRKAHHLTQQIKHIYDEIDALRIMQKAALQELEVAKLAMISSHKTVDEQELIMQELDQKADRVKHRLDQVTNQREYMALQSEMAQVQQEQQIIEQEVLSAWNQRGATESAYAIAAKRYEEQDRALQEQIAQKLEQATQREQEHDQFMTQRAAKVKSVPAEWMEKYETMGAHAENPIVPTEGNSCSSCFYQITAQELLQLQKGSLLQCRNCFRFLYVPHAVSE